MKKKIISLLLLVALSVTFTGCNLDEIGLVNTLQTMSSLTEFTFEGKILSKINSIVENPDYVEPEAPIDENDTPILFDELTDADPLLSPDISDDLMMTPGLFMLAPFFGMGEEGEYGMVYSGSISKEQNKIVLKLEQKANEEVTPVLQIIFTGKTLFVDKNTADNFMIPYIDTDLETIDETEYVKLNVDDLITEYCDSMRAMYADAPCGNFYLDPEGEYSEDYYQGYAAGFAVGEQEGYFGTVTPKGEELTADYEAGYTDGYDAGLSCGQSDKAIYEEYKDENLQSIADANALEETLKANIDSANLIKMMTGTNPSIVNEIINTLFKDFSPALIKKDSTGKYIMDVSAGDLLDAAGNAVKYILDNEALFKTTLKTIVNNMTDEEMQKLTLDPDSRDEILTGIDDIEFPQGPDIAEVKNDITQSIASIKASIDEEMDLKCRYSLEKTGSNSYDSAITIAMKSLENTISPYLMDQEIILTLSINKEKTGDVEVTENVSAKNVRSAQIKLVVTDENAVESGIMYSLSQDFSNPKTVVGTKQADGTYLIDLSGLNPNTKYYYKSYTKDQNGNLVFSTSVKTFNTAVQAATDDSNPATGDHSVSTALFLALAFIAATGCLFATKNHIVKQ